MCGATGVPPSLFEGNADGTSQREAWRWFCHGSVAPVARIVARELADKLDVPGLTFGFDALYASDVVGRAGAFSAWWPVGWRPRMRRPLSGLMPRAPTARFGLRMETPCRSLTAGDCAAAQTVRDLPPGP